MDTKTMLLIIAIVVLCFALAIVRVRRRVQAEDRALQLELDQLVKRHDANNRAYAERGEQQRIERFGDRSRAAS